MPDVTQPEAPRPQTESLGGRLKSWIGRLRGQVPVEPARVIEAIAHPDRLPEPDQVVAQPADIQEHVQEIAQANQPDAIQPANPEPPATVEEIPQAAVPVIEQPQPKEFDYKQYEVPQELTAALNAGSSSREMLSRAITSLNALPLENAIGIYTRVVAEGRDMDISTRAMSQMTNALNDRLRSMRPANQPLQLTAEQTQAVQGFFDRMKAKLPDVRRSSSSYRESGIRSSLHSLINQNKELGVMATPIFSDMLVGISTKEEMSEAITSLNALPLENAIGIYTRVVAEGRDMDISTRAMSQMTNALNDRLRSMRPANQPLQLTAEQTQAVQGFFDRMKAKLPDVRRSSSSYRESGIRSSLHSLINQNKELGVMATPIFSDMLVGISTKEEMSEAITSLNALPLENAIGIYTRVVAEGRDMDISTRAMSQMTNALNDRLRSMRPANQPLQLTAEQTQAVQGFFDRMKAKLPDVRRSSSSYRESGIRSSLHSLINQNKELGVMATPIFSDMLVGISTKEEMSEAITSLNALPLENAIGIYTRVVAEGRDMDISTRAMSQMTNALNDRLRSMRPANQPLQLTAEQTQAVQGFFDRMKAKLPDVRRSSSSYRESGIRSSLHSLINQNKELGVMATPIFSDMLVGISTKEEMSEAITSLNALPLENAIGIYTRVVAEGRDMDISTRAMSQMTNALNDRLRSMRPANQPLQLTAEQTQAVQGFFDRMKAKLPDVRRSSSSYRESGIRSSLHSLINQNQEIQPLANDLIEKIGREANEALVERVSTYVPHTPTAQVQTVIERGTDRVVAVTQSIDRYRGLNRVIQSLPADMREEVVHKLNDSLANDQTAPTRMAILESIVSVNRSNDLHMDTILQRNHVTLDQLPEILGDAAVVKLIDIMANEPDRYKFQLGVLLSQVPFDRLSDSLSQKLKPVLANLEFQIKVGHESWWLCGEAEPRLLDCVRNGASVLVNDFLLVKFKGKFSGLCVRTTTLPSGQTFLEGNWYSPAGEELRQSIRHGYDMGNTRLAIPTGDWAMIRPLANDQTNGLTANDILERAQAHAANMPARVPDLIEGMSRIRYREQRDEVHG